MVLSDVSIKRPVFITMVILAIVVFGAVSYPRIGVDLYPDIEFPVATILTIYPGADPETVETEISEKLEEAVSTINGIRSLRSISAENVSQVIIMFEMEVNAEQAIQDVRDKISRILPDLPAEIESPKVEKFDMDAIPVMTLAVSGPGTISEVTEFARKRIKEQIQQIQGVGSIDIIGGQEREIKVWVDPRKLEARNLAVTDIVQVLAASNLSIPGGRVTAGDTEFVLKIDGEFQNLDEIRNLTVVEQQGRRIRIADIATVEDGLEERESAAKLDGTRAVTLKVLKQSGTNTVAVAEKLKERLAELQPAFPDGWRVIIAADSTPFIQTSIEHVQFDMIFGAFLAVVIIFFFLRNGRSTIISALAIPTSVIGTFTFIYVMDFTFNTLTMLALSISIGILIDDAIVVLENIYRHMEEGMSAREAAAFATDEIGLAVLATTLSIVAVFVPVAFMGGIIGRFMYQFGLTVTVAVLLSLFVSFTLTPMLSSRFLKKGGQNKVYDAIERFLNWIDSGYRSVISLALNYRKTTVIAAISIFILSLYMGTFISTEMKTRADMGEINVVLTLPTGSTIEHTERMASELAEKVRAHRDVVVSTVTTVGSDAQKKKNVAQIYVKLCGKGERDISQGKFIELLRAELTSSEEATITVEDVDAFASSGGFRSAPIQLSIRGGDLEELDRVTRELADEIKLIPGVVDLDTTFEASKPELKVNIDRERAANLGLMTAQVGQTLRAFVAGVEASKYKDSGEDYEIRVQLAETDREREEQLGMLKIRSSNGQLVSLANTADIYVGSGPTQIDRSARQREITVLANLDTTLPLGDAVQKINAVAEKVVPKHLMREWEGEAKFMKENFEHMSVALFLAIIIVYMVLASQFESFLQPFTIMLSLPLSLIGALAGLLLAKQALGIISMIGIIMLMGLVTKNAILLIDYTNTLRRRDGFSRREALLKAGPTRLRPILMTTGAMVFGMLPVALSNGLGSEMRAPMAVAVIGGLIASTVLTLVVIPVVYTLIDDLEHSRLARLLLGKKESAEVEATVNTPDVAES